MLLDNYAIRGIQFAYPKSIIELGLVDFDIWFLMETKQATGNYHAMQKLYPNRTLIPFATRGDNDDIACFEI